MAKTHKLKIIALASVVGLTFGAGALAHSKTISLTADVGYVNIKHLPGNNGKISPIRLQAIKETATELGARGALAWQSLHIDQSLQQTSQHLDHIFSFNQLLIDNDVLPPVITQSNNALTLDSDDTIRLASKTYDIVSPARFVTAAPTWRTYLWMDYKKPTLPSKTLFPTTKAEAEAWNYYLKQGWLSGIQQANEIFRENLARLKRDYSGMVLYNQLLAQHMVSKPFVAKADLGVTGNGNQIRINDQVLRITAASQLQPNAAKWTPVITK